MFAKDTCTCLNDTCTCFIFPPQNLTLYIDTGAAEAAAAAKAAAKAAASAEAAASASAKASATASASIKLVIDYSVKCITLAKLYCRIITGISISLLVTLSTIVLVRVIIRPTKPNFILQDATVYAFNVSSPNLITCNFQVTLSARNPHDNIGVYYDKADVYATYGNQEITGRTAIPPTYQGHNGINVWSPFVYGTTVPVAPYNAELLCQDQINGVVSLMFKIDGRVRWKVGPFHGSYRLYVKCPAIINFGNKQSGIVVGENVVKYQLMHSCSVSV